MSFPSRTPLGLRILIPLFLLTGCTAENADSGPAKPPRRVPAKGVIRLDGKPLAGAVVTYLPMDDKGTLTVSDTLEDGSYELTFLTFPGGTAPGHYKVGVSYMLTPTGKIVTLGMRSALATPADVINAKELLPPKYSDLGRTVLSVDVPPEGGSFNFDLQGPMLEPPKPQPPAPSKPEAEEAGESARSVHFFRASAGNIGVSSVFLSGNGQGNRC